NHKQGDVVIVGGGLTGIESATEFAERYPNLRVKLITSGAFGAELSRRGADYLRRIFAKRNITIHDKTRVTQVDAHTLTLADGTTISHDVGVWAASLIAPALAQESGLQVNHRRQLLIDASM